mmetsp:Transcript_26261/g.40705  ORF Transcript_26261/g.40705 Transcript_26261/m.40705 type:complete len:133 (+) Transcript_26261:337-735(+)
MIERRETYYDEKLSDFICFFFAFFFRTTYDIPLEAVAGVMFGLGNVLFVLGTYYPTINVLDPSSSNYKHWSFVFAVVAAVISFISVGEYRRHQLDDKGPKLEKYSSALEKLFSRKKRKHYEESEFSGGTSYF